MASAPYRVRRATLDDVGQLTALWRSMSLPVEDLVRRITEFQVAEAQAGELLGAVGLQVTDHQGLIHSEAFLDFALADHLRPLIWERLQSLARNLGLVRLWTQEQAPFWGHCGLAKPEATALEKLPAPWRTAAAGWRTLKLREDYDEILSADKEFALFMEAERQRTQRLRQHARLFKFMVAAIAFGILILVILGVVFLMQKGFTLGGLGAWGT